ncbi:branched-chain amino acid ABC transporter permease [Lutibaculum baratangense]|uniref:Branched-chain amino acid transport system permease protein LivM n=1 Tax=Lutibaculum baratangense AMV1 TaxID=631454 RepID=V4RLB0_9HYPH|nr:branched-chain amino acid ABC transporter permease [Lutibaculum baratangense]ESR26841.1 Branched-chain amino acid transport system permease protein LivM [Lutibaculum baratangense AMV1]
MSDLVSSASTSDVPATPRLRGTVALLVPAAIFLAFALAPLLVHAGLDPFYLSIVVRIMIFAIAAVSLDLILGFGGLVSFGHAAFLGIGAYAVGILASHGAGDAFLQLPVALFASAVFAFLTGWISLRTKGVHFIMITLAFAQMAYFMMTSLSAYGGDDGMTLWTRSTVAGSKVLGDTTAFYYACLGALILSYAICRCLVVSRFGRVLRGAKENAVRMEAIGFDPFRFRLVAYVVSGMICGLAGFLLANHTEYVSPAYMAWQRSGELLIMVILGGLGTLHGAIIGATAFLFLEEWLAGFTEHWRIVFGPLLVLVAIFMERGILGAVTRRRR